jgi:hypothetical protein
MSNRLYPCSVSDPLGEGANSGLLGQGALPWPSVIAERHFPKNISISGFYATDELSAAHFMVATLSDPDNGMDEQEHEQMALHLSYLLFRIKIAGYVTAREVNELHQKAQSIPVIGSVIFSLSTLPGEVASLAGMLHSLSKGARLADTLNLPPHLKKQLLNWANTRGATGSVSAKKAFKQSIKLVRIQGQLHFEVPANAKAKLFKIGGKTATNLIHIPAYNAAQVLKSRVPITASAYGSRGVGRVIISNTAGGLWSMGPQAIIDAATADSFNDFMHKSAYSQPANILAIAAGIILIPATASAVVVLGITTATGVLIQVVMSDDFTGWNRSIGNFLTGSSE